MDQEDGEVHRNAELQNRGQRLRDVRDLAKKDVGAEVEQNRKADAQNDEKRRDVRVDAQKQNDQNEGDRDQYVNRNLTVREVSRVLRNRGHTADEAVLLQELFHLANGAHRRFGGSGSVKGHDDKRRILAIKSVLKVLGQHLPRDAEVCDVIDPIDFIDAFDLLELFLKLQDVAVRHALHRDHCGACNVEVLVKGFFADDRVEVARKIGQNIVIDFRGLEPKHGQYRKNTGNGKDEPFFFYDKSCKAH